ncbi:hypothetical protein F53441_4608 [Fusarium austroafricanum]|uniref:Uncharacterized protein n=1 Tax=Fusarium austroafricanum TaxID=2364996 RepID=A0A8H4KNI8_9HYPO|nr:hypothetical protein F53441_4608 [Fusarium austroafricanum]
MANRTAPKDSANETPVTETDAHDASMEPYPARITAKDWERANACWLDKLLELESTKDKIGPIMDREVTTQTFPLISQNRRNLLRVWARAEQYPLDSTLFETPIETAVEVPRETSRRIFQTETDMAKRSTWVIQTAALSLPKSQGQTARLIKWHVDRLVDQKMDNRTLMSDGTLSLPGYVEMILCLKTHMGMGEDEIETWMELARGINQTAKEAAHSHHWAHSVEYEWSLLVSRARQRGGLLLETAIDYHRSPSNPNYMKKRDPWYREKLFKKQY